MKTLLLSLMISGIAFAQSTKPGTGQLKSERGTPAVLIVLPSGAVTLAVLGPGVSLDTTGPRPVIRATAPVPVSKFGVVLTPASPGSGLQLTWTLPEAPNPTTLRVHRNGVRMTAGVDYTLSGAQITFTADQGAYGDDLIVADYNLPMP